MTGIEAVVTSLHPQHKMLDVILFELRCAEDTSNYPSDTLKVCNPNACNTSNKDFGDDSVMRMMVRCVMIMVMVMMMMMLIMMMGGGDGDGGGQVMMITMITMMMWWR